MGSALFGGVASDDDGEPAESWQERLWAALAHPLKRHELRQLAAAMPGGTEGKADRYVDACVKAGTVVATGPAGGARTYQRANRDEREETASAPASRARRPAVTEAEEGPGDEEDDGDRDEDDVAPKARLNRFGFVERVEVELGDELEEEEADDEATPRDEGIEEEDDDQEERAEAAVAPARETRRTTEEEPMAKGDVKTAVLKALVTMGTGRCGEIAKAAGVSTEHAGAVLSTAFRDGEIGRPSRGLYEAKGNGRAAAVTKTAKPKTPGVRGVRDASTPAVTKPTARARELGPPVTTVGDDFDAALADLIAKKAAYDDAKRALVLAAGGVA